MHGASGVWLLQETPNGYPRNLLSIRPRKKFPAGGGGHMLAASWIIFFVVFPEKVDISGHCQLS